jgi:hypothetical protein
MARLTVSGDVAPAFPMSDVVKVLEFGFGPADLARNLHQDRA